MLCVGIRVGKGVNYIILVATRVVRRLVNSDGQFNKCGQIYRRHKKGDSFEYDFSGIVSAETFQIKCHFLVLVILFISWQDGCSSSALDSF